MTKEEEQLLLKRIEDLEKKVIQVNLEPTEKENVKNAIFESFIENNSATAKSDSTAYLKVIWKNKIIYIPYYI